MKKGEGGREKKRGSRLATPYLESQVYLTNGDSRHEGNDDDDDVEDVGEGEEEGVECR